MSARRVACCWLLALAGLLVHGCSENPEAPRFANPFDPTNPDDPFQLAAAYANQAVVLTWNQPAGHEIVYYDVLRSPDGVSFGELGSVTATAQPTATFTDHEPIPTATSYYKVVAVASDSSRTTLGQTAHAPVAVPLLVSVAGGQTTTRVRRVPVRVRASGYEVAHVARTGDFAAELTAAFGPDSSAVFEDFDLGEAAANDVALRVFAYASRVIDVGGTPVTFATDTVEVVLTVSFHPTLDLPPGTTTVPGPLVDLAIGGGPAGITRLRLASSREELASAAWREPADLIEDVALRDTPQPQSVFAEFESEFSPALTVVDEQVVTPDLLTDVGFRLDVAENRVISDPVVGVINDAVATHMRVSTDPGFRDEPWVPYADQTTITLAETPGFHVVYAQFRNHWAESAVQTDWAIFAQGDVAVEFQDPVDGDVVPGGAFVQLRGRAWSRDDADAPIDSVKVNVGAGYELAAGTQQWSYDWDVPRLGGDTPTLVAARAYTHRTIAEPESTVVDSATALITLTVSQLAVAIDTPAGGAEVAGGSDVAVTGTATPYLLGAPLDSVVVVVGGQRIRATGLAEWAATWTAPAVEAPQPVQLAARAFAGADSVQALVEFAVVPASVQAP